MEKKGEISTPHTALYRKYRPRSLADIVSQSQVTDVLMRSLEKGKIAHAYLLTGPKGVGKTSIARILAHEINKLPYNAEETHLDIIEIDAASNNGVDNVRDLRDKVQLTPIAAAKKVYIIDEVHMLSKPAFNALLKTLEEPPAHVVFILATTDLHKVPATIISRTQHFSFHSISQADLATQLKKIAKSEKLKITDDAVEAIASRGDGSFRDSISLLDQMSSFADEKDGITLELVQATLGLASQDAVDTLLVAVDGRDIAGVINTIDNLEKQGIQPNVLADQLIRTLRERLGDQPQLVGLLDALLSVSTSPQPQLKLLTTLVGSIKPPTVQRTAAAHASKPSPTVIEAPVIVIKQEVEKVAEPAAQQTKPTKKNSVSVPFDWIELVDYIKQNFIALHSVIGKCDYDFDGDVLTIYAGLKFNKTKLDQAKYLAQFHEALTHIGQENLAIITIAESKPLADEKLAKVAAIMGGGKEVSVEEIGEAK